MQLHNTKQPNCKSRQLTFLIYEDGSVSLDPSILPEDASKLFSYFIELCQIISEEPELALEVFDLPREGASTRGSYG